MTESGSLAFSVLGYPFEATGVDRELASWLGAWWNYPEHTLAHETRRITLAVEEHAPLQPTGGKARSVDLSNCVLHFIEGEGWWETSAPEWGLRLSMGPATTRIALWGLGRWTADQARFYSSLQVMLTEALRREGLVPLHAAAASRDGIVTIWLGPSGSGKSTTLLSAARAGWTPIAEDLCWLNPKTLMVYGWDRSVRVWPETLERFFPDLISLSVPESDGKHSVPYRHLGSGTRSGRLGRITVLASDWQNPSRSEPVSPVDAVRALWEATGVPLSPHAIERTALVIPQLVQSTGITRTILGNTPVAL